MGDDFIYAFSWEQISLKIRAAKGKELSSELSHTLLHSLSDGHTGAVNSMASLPSLSTGTAWGRFISAGADASLRIWSKKGIPPQVLVGHSTSVTCVANNEKKIFSGGEEGIIRVWYS